MNHAIVNKKDVFPTPFADMAPYVQGYSLCITFCQGFHFDQLGIHVVRSGFCQRRKRVGCHPLPGRNSDIHPFFQSLLAQVLPPFPDKNSTIYQTRKRIDSQCPIPTVYDWSYVTRKKVICFYGFYHSRIELFLSIGNVHAVHFA